MYGHPQAVAEMTEIFGELISTYTRAQALDDGVLVDVSAIAAEAGFKWPAAMTRAAWEDCVAWGEADSKRQTYQDEALAGTGQGGEEDHRQRRVHQCSQSPEIGAPAGGCCGSRPSTRSGFCCRTTCSGSVRASVLRRGR